MVRLQRRSNEEVLQQNLIRMKQQLSEEPYNGDLRRDEIHFQRRSTELYLAATNIARVGKSGMQNQQELNVAALHIINGGQRPEQDALQQACQQPYMQLPISAELIGNQNKVQSQQKMQLEYCCRLRDFHLENLQRMQAESKKTLEEMASQNHFSRQAYITKLLRIYTDAQTWLHQQVMLQNAEVTRSDLEQQRLRHAAPDANRRTSGETAIFESQAHQAQVQHEVMTMTHNFSPEAEEMKQRLEQLLLQQQQQQQNNVQLVLLANIFRSQAESYKKSLAQYEMKIDEKIRYLEEMMPKTSSTTLVAPAQEGLASYVPTQDLNHGFLTFTSETDFFNSYLDQGILTAEMFNFSKAPSHELVDVKGKAAMDSSCTYGTPDATIDMRPIILEEPDPYSCNLNDNKNEAGPSGTWA